MLNQTEFLEPVIAYLTDVMTRKESHTEEHKAAKKLFSKLAADFRKDEQTLGVLYREYLERYHTKEPRGFLMLALACYGDAIVPQLVLDHAANPLSRGPIEHLLMQMIMRGGVMATDALITFVKDAHSAEASRTTSFLLRGLLTLAGHNHNHSGAIAVRDMVEQHMPALKRRPLPEIQSFLRRYQELEWGEANVDALIDSVVDGTLTDPERQLLRRLASVVSPRLLAVAQDSEKSPDERVRALDALGVLRRAATPQLADSLWTVFSDTDIEDVRVGVVRAFGTLELDPGASARTVLFDLIQKGSPRLAEEIQLAWDRIFTAASLA
ncbi:hypothetical protein CCR91_06380 [Thiorhodovibrio winogradskyi]|nr:hypothetical protein [Thiorhodovibrio winogradskyi]